MVAPDVVIAEAARPEGALQPEPAVMVKLVLEISKNIFPTASTFILAVVVAVLGMVSTSVPSLGVLADSTVGNVCPPSVDKDIFTFAQLTGAAVVLATAQVIVCDELPAHDTAVLGELTEKGPETKLTITVISLNCFLTTVNGQFKM